MKLVNEVKKFAEKKGVTPAQLAIAWVRSHSGKKGMPVIIPIPASGNKARVLENTKDISLSEGEFAEIEEILKNFKVVGDRCTAMAYTSL